MPYDETDKQMSRFCEVIAAAIETEERTATDGMKSKIGGASVGEGFDNIEA